MKKAATLIIAICSICCKTNAQLDSAALQKMAKKVEITFELNDKEDFGPARLAFANMLVFMPRNNETTFEIRKLLLSGKFKDASSLFRWLLPVVDKIALQNYLSANDDISNDYKALYINLSSATCPCFETFKKAGVENIYSDSASMACLRHIWADTVLMSTVIKKIRSLNDNDKIAFLQGLVRFSQISCDNYFTVLLSSSLQDIPGEFEKRFENYKHQVFLDLVHYNATGKNDSLAALFPSSKQFLPALQNAAAISKKYNNIDYPSMILVKTDAFERRSSFFVQYINGKPNILGQSVYEVGIDRPLLYIKAFQFYPREKLQNIQKIEQAMPPQLKDVE